jgi:hypothetical protein
MPIRVVIVDDQDMARSGFAALLSTQSDIDVVGEASHGRLDIEVCRSTPPIPTWCSWTSACRSWTDCRLPGGCSTRRPASSTARRCSC